MCVCVACFLVGCDTEDFNIAPETLSNVQKNQSSFTLDYLNSMSNEELTEYFEDTFSAEQMESRVMSDGSDCNCEIRVQSIQYFDNNNHPAPFEGIFTLNNTQLNGVPPAQTGCNGCFGLFWNSGTANSICTNTTNCSETYDLNKRIGNAEAFNCVVPKYSNFNVRATARLYNNANTCTLVNPGPGQGWLMINYRILCSQDGQIPPGPSVGSDCNENGGQSLFFTDRSITIAVGSPQVFTEVVTLEDCGCVPSF